MNMKYCLIFIVSCVSLLVQGENENTFTISLKRQKSSFEQHLNNAPLLKKYGMNVDWLYKKHKPNPTPRTNDSIPLYRYLDNEFYGSIVIGHPGQILNVAFDTSWPWSWVLSSRCHVFNYIGCLFHNKYDHDKSSEYKPDNRPIVIPEGKSKLEGFFSYDNISISHSNVTNFSFIEMTAVPRNMVFSKIDGILGLGLESNNYEPFFYALFRQKKMKEPIFCVYLNRDKQSKHGGNVIMGFLEKRHVSHWRDKNNQTVYADIKYMPVKPGDYWQFDLDTVFLNDTKNPLTFCTGKGCTAMTDTSSNNILGPTADINQIHEVIKARPFFLDRYTIDCDTINKLPHIAFTIGGQNFTLKGRDYTIKMSHLSITMCLTAFVPHEYNDLWVLGGAFLSEYYTIYNIQDKQIGIVKAA